MANIWHIVVFGVLVGIINVANSDENCADPFKKYREHCIAQGLDKEAVFICTLMTSGVIGGKGQLYADRYKELLLSYAVPGKEENVDIVVKVMQNCLNKAESINSPEDASMAFGNCTTTLEPAFDLLDEALCESMNE